MIIKEGEAQICLPYVPGSDRGPARRKAVFYNPAMRENRTLCTLFVDALGVNRFLDAFCGTGIRGLRVAKECKSVLDLTFNDVGAEACSNARKNLELNNVNAEVVEDDFNLLDMDVDYCDVDPFGTPTPFLDHALKISNHFLGITATDTAVFYASQPKKCLERYGAKVFKVPWAKELGARVMCGFVSERARALGRGVKPIFVYPRDHYLRGYFEVCELGDENLVENITFNGKILGPIWVGKLKERRFIDTVLKILCQKSFEGKKSLEKILKIALKEGSELGFYDMDALSGKFHREQPRLDRVVEELREGGYAASRTVFSPKGLKTDASEEELRRFF